MAPRRAGSIPLRSPSVIWRNIPIQYKVLRYETLVTQPRPPSANCAPFLARNSSRRCFPCRVQRDFVRKGGNSTFEHFEPAAITTAAVGRYHKVLSKRDVAFIQVFAGAEMRSFDYAPRNWTYGAAT